MCLFYRFFSESHLQNNLLCISSIHLDNQWAFKYGAMMEFGEHSKGIGYGTWQAVEALHPETVVWETCTPYFEKRNIHFYVNKCGFQIDQFWCEYFQLEHDMSEDEEHNPDEGPDEMFRFIKVMK